MTPESKTQKKNIIIIGLYLAGIYPSGDDSVISNLLAPAFLKSTADADEQINPLYDIKILYFSTATSPLEIFRKVCGLNPYIAAYSVYMWNYTLTQESSRLIKNNLPDIRIVLGGPQVSYNSEDVLISNTQIDLIVCGSGESRFKQVIKSNFNPESLSKIPQITYRDKDGNIVHTKGGVQEDLSLVPSPYQTNTIDLNDGNRHTVFIETFRGCPFKCGYCVWGDSRELNKFPIEQILKDIEIVYNNPNVEVVYLVDSCIFYMRQRAKEIIDKIASCSRKIPTVATLDILVLDEEMIRSLDKIELIRNQFHFGLQTTNQLALQLLKRKSRKEDFENKIALLRKVKPSAQISLDLIYGLPGDNYEGFRESVDFALSLKPGKLYLSPLLVLPGTLFWDKKSEFGFDYDNKPPYMVRSNKYYSQEDMEKTIHLVLWVLAIFYFPAIRDAICGIPQHFYNLKRIDLVGEFIDRICRKIKIAPIGASVVIPGSNVKFDYTIESNNLLRRKFMDIVTRPENCAYIYETMLEILRPLGIEQQFESISRGFNYYNGLYQGFSGKESKAEGYIKHQWVSAESLSDISNEAEKEAAQ